MKLSEFAGMGEKMTQLMRSAQAGRIVHALLFTGPRGTGKRTMADLFARALLCTQPGADGPCGACPACKRFLEGTHPDVHRLAPEKNIIHVDEVRALTDALGLAAYEGGRKIAVIERADSMNEQAQNALLKTLENPSGDTLFFLLTEQPTAMLPTIVSRCLTVRFRTLEPEECAGVLIRRGIEPARARTLACLSHGSVGRALEIDADVEYMELRARVISAIEGLKKPADVARVTERIGDVKGREGAVLEILELWARELMRVQNGLEPIDPENRARLAAAGLNGSRLEMLIMQARKQLSSNLSWTNVLESMNYRLVTEKG